MKIQALEILLKKPVSKRLLTRRILFSSYTEKIKGNFVTTTKIFLSNEILDEISKRFTVTHWYSPNLIFEEQTIGSECSEECKNLIDILNANAIEKKGKEYGIRNYSTKQKNGRCNNNYKCLHNKKIFKCKTVV